MMHVCCVDQNIISFLQKFTSREENRNIKKLKNYELCLFCILYSLWDLWEDVNTSWVLINVSV